MRKIYLLSSMLVSAALMLTGCGGEEDLYQGPVAEEKVYNDFDFSTVASGMPVKISYANMGVNASVYFEIYDENPVTENEYSYTKRSDVTPLYAAYTNNKGVFEGNLDLPAYLSKVYIYTPAFYAQTLIEAEVSGGQIVASDAAAAAAKMLTRALSDVTDKAYDSYMVVDNPPAKYSDNRWKTWLGEYDRYRHGAVVSNTSGSHSYTGYEYKGTELIPSDLDSLYTIHSSVIEVGDSKKCPEIYRSYTDMLVSKEAEVAVTFLGGATCWTSSLGYYYYDKNNVPSSLKDVNVIMLFPNTQDGNWPNGIAASQARVGIDRKTTVQLKYYPNIASGSEEGGTTKFPAGTKIGFVLATNAWENRVSGGNWLKNDKYYRAATSKGLSCDTFNVAYADEARTAVYQYNNSIMISFEDHINDENFSDVVITMKSNPVNAIIDIPVVTETTVTTETLKGIYAFEDLWPSTGDYDMNDVMVRYKYGKTFDTDNKIYAETFTFHAFNNYVTLKNGLAFRISDGSTPTSLKCEVSTDGTTFVETTEDAKFSYEPDDNVYVLTDNVLGYKAYRVTLNYENGITKESTATPFIWRAGTTEGTRWEVHIATEKPTSKVDTSYFGTGDDASNTTSGPYYVREGNYPFAFFLAGADEDDLAPMLDRANESIPVSDLYSGYTGWATSGGTTNKDWYKASK